MSCRLCDDFVESGIEFCKSHKIAAKNLDLGYEIWKNRLDFIERKDYLKTLLEISTTGTLVKQVIMDELGEEKRYGDKKEN
tara:strand:- start:10071 stop:10313 length:243 start_codon:yes stop_codon:yes gene_type:complete